MSDLNPFQAHPASVGETYFQHQRTAFGFGMRMIGGGAACLLHGLLPFLCGSTGSRQIAVLHDRMIRHRHRETAGTSSADPMANL
jgi:hypothetical protein